MYKQFILLIAFLALLSGFSALSRVSGTYNGKYYDYSRYPTTGLPSRYYDDDESGLSRVSGTYNGKYYDFKKYPTTGLPSRYYDDDEEDLLDLFRLGTPEKYLKHVNYRDDDLEDDLEDDIEEEDEYCICVKAPCPCDNFKRFKWD